MTIRRKLQIVNVVLVIVAIVIGAILYTAEHRVSRSIKEVQDALEELETYRDMKISLLKAAIAVRNLIFDPKSEEARKAIDKNLKKYLSDLAKLRKNQRKLTKEETELTKNLAFFTYQGDIESVKQLIEMEAYDEAKETLIEVEKAGFKDTMDTLDRLVKLRLQEIAKKQNKMMRNLRMANIIAVGLTVPAILLVSFLLWIVSKDIIKQINTLSSKVEEIASGMKFQNIEFKRFKSELDRLIEALSNMIGEVGKAIGSIRETMMKVAKGNLKVRIEGDYRGDLKDLSNYINSSLGDLQTALRSVKEGFTNIARSIEVLTTNAEKIERENDNLSGSIASIMTSVDETSEAIRQISEETLKARNTSIDMERAIENGKEKVEVMHGAMGNIVQVSQEISSITETIINIAEQTNLLALNAAIEAARAGEMGRGFAVVADEVRRLAEISGNAAREIAALVEKAMNAVEEGRVASEDVVESYRRIEEVTQEIVRAIDTIATAMEEQSRAIDIIRDNMTDITNISEKNTESVKEIVEEIRNINRTASQVEEKMKGFDV